MTDVKSMTMEELKEFMTKIGEKPFRAKQIYAWLHQQLVTSWDEMTNLSKSLREKLSAYPITALTQADVRISKILCAFLLRWAAVWDADSVHLPSED